MGWYNRITVVNLPVDEVYEIEDPQHWQYPEVDLAQQATLGIAIERRL